MKKTVWGALCIGALTVVTGCRSPGPITTTLALAGPVGTPLSGYYLECGQRVAFQGVLPFELQRVGVSEIGIQTVNPDQTVVLVAQTDRHGWHSEVSSSAGPGATGFHICVQKGLTVEKTLPCSKAALASGEKQHWDWQLSAVP